MSFLSALGLLVGLFVALPYVAHRLRRERADERKFAFTDLVPAMPPKARRRNALEDRPLFGLRALSILAIAVLGAAPLVRCDRLSLARNQGASVALALVIDDSMSMRAPGSGKASRFAESKAAALSLVAQAQEGDSMMVVAAGAPARMLLAPTTDRDAVEDALGELEESDRATDLEGALGLAKSALAKLPQVDKRVMVFSDRADGNPEGGELAKGDDSVWFPLPELAKEVPNCAVLSADRQPAQVRVRVRCMGGATLEGRALELSVDGKVLSSTPAGTGTAVETNLPLSNAVARGGQTGPWVRLTGQDAIAADDRAPADGDPGQTTLGIVSLRRDESLATGGAPVVERALASLHQPVELRAIPGLSDSPEELGGFAGLVLDDPAGFTPEERLALQRFLDEGHSILLALGPGSHRAPLGASFEPLFEGKVTYAKSPVRGVDTSSVLAPLAEAKEGLVDLAPEGRATLSERTRLGFSVLANWSDGQPLLLQRSLGRGTVWIVTLPFSLDESDLPLRPAFLDLLQTFVDDARERGLHRRIHPGERWFLRGATTVTGTGPAGKLTSVKKEGDGVSVVPPLLGRYELAIDGRNESFGTVLDPRELDTRPRPVSPTQQRGRDAGEAARVDVSWAVALFVLALLFAELLLRTLLGQRAHQLQREQDRAAVGES